MIGNLARRRRVQGFPQQPNDDRVELSTPAKKGQQSPRIVRTAQLRHRNSSCSSPRNERFAIKGPTGACGGSVENLRRQDSLETRERPLSGAIRGRLTFPYLEAITLLSNRCHLIFLPVGCVPGTVEAPWAGRRPSFQARII